MNLTGNPFINHKGFVYTRVISKHYLSLFASILSATGFFFFSPRISAAIIGINILFILIAPFSQRLSFFLPIITKSKTATSSISLTFDDGPDPMVTGKLLDLLARHSIKATFFVIGKKAGQNPHLIARMVKEGHEIGNHSQNHDNILMLRSKNTLFVEVSNCQIQLRKLGIESFAFRPPVGITNPKLFRILALSGMYCVGFSCRPVDFGNRKTKNLNRKILNSVKAGDIVLLHDSKPSESFYIDRWLDQVENIIIQATKKGLRFVPLSTLIGRPVMSVNPGDHPLPGHPVKAVFDYSAQQYDFSDHFKQLDSTDPFLDEFLDLLIPNDSVLEIGAGTGRQTFRVAELVKDITAIDTSELMLRQLTHKISIGNAPNISTICVDATILKTDKQFDKTFSFYCFEYIPDLRLVFQSLYDHLKPGGLLYFAIPERSLKNSLFKLRIGLKFGINVNLRGKKEITQLLRDAKFTSIEEVIPKERSKSAIIAFSARK